MYSFFYDKFFLKTYVIAFIVRSAVSFRSITPFLFRTPNFSSAFDGVFTLTKQSFDGETFENSLAKIMGIPCY